MTVIGGTSSILIALLLSKGFDSGCQRAGKRGRCVPWTTCKEVVLFTNEHTLIPEDHEMYKALQSSCKHIPSTLPMVCCLNASIETTNPARGSTTASPRPLMVRYENFVPKKCGEGPTKDGFLKWNVFIQIGHSYRNCVGTLISRSFVLTAANCVKGSSRNEIKLFLGQVDMNVDYTQPDCLDMNRCQQLNGEDVWIHPEYDVEKNQFDVALIKTDLPVAQMEAIQPICLPLNVTVHDTRKENEKVLRPRYKNERYQTRRLCGYSGAPIIVKDRDQRYNIVGLGKQKCRKMGFLRDRLPIVEYLDWIISTLPNGEKERPMS